MKKIKIFLVFILSLFFINNAFSYSLDFSGKGFYSNISSNISDVNDKMFKIESQNNGGLKQKINEKIGKECISKDLTQKEFNDIAVKGEISNIQYIISKECFKDGKLDKGTFDRIISSISEVYNESKNSSKSKSNKLISFSNIGIYNDGIEENGPFDLMVDFEEIDKIIFIQSETKNDFKEEKEVKLNEKINKLLNKLNKNNSNGNNSSSNNSSGNNIFNDKNNLNPNSDDNKKLTICSLDGNCDNYTEVQKLLCETNGNCDHENNKPGFLNIKNDFACKVDTSGLNTVSSKIISTNLSIEKKEEENSEDIQENIQQNSNFGNSNNFSSSKNSSLSSGNTSIINSGNKVTNPSGGYKKLDDNKQFPCNDFLCIDINFKTYSFSTSGEPTIEYLINRSNNHLKKFVNSSLSQAQMTVNNFELNLKNVDLPSMFHLGIQISYEPVPILKVDDSEKDKEDKGETKLTSQLEKYYKANGLEYKLRNDLSAFENIEKEKQAAINSNSTTINEMGKKYKDLEFQREETLKSLNNIEKLIEEKVKFEKIDFIDKQLKEMERFNAAVNIYVLNLEAILKEIKKIPVDKTKT